MTNKKINFLTDFPAISTQEWMDKITADLKGADFSKKLVWRTPEGFNVNPNRNITNSIAECKKFCDEWEFTRHELDYATDGIVIKVNEFDLYDTLLNHDGIMMACRLIFHP